MLPLGEELRAALGEPANPRRLASSPRSRVWQVELSGTPAVVKQAVAGPDADERYARESTALRLAARVDPPVAPALLGADPQQRVLVLEHLDHRHRPEDWIVGYAEALARLHAATTAADEGALPAWSGPTHADVESFLALARTIGVPVPPGAADELGGVVDRLTPGHALLHGDPCPGNDLHTDGGVRFVDFEQAALGDGLVELVYPRIGFPTCWCVTAPPEPLLDSAESAYRAAWRAATGTDHSGDVARACVGWLVRGDALVRRAHRDGTDHFARLPREDLRWGTVDGRQRLAHRLGVVARLLADRSDLHGLAGLCVAMGERISRLWPAPPPPSRRPWDEGD